MKKDNINKKIDYLIEVVDFMKDNVVTKKEFDEKMSGVEDRLGRIENRLTGVETRQTKSEALMVTKDYLDDKLAGLRGDLVVLMRKEDTKVKSLVGILQKKKLLTANEAKQIFTMEPFAQVA